MLYRLGQSFARPFAGYPYPKKKRRPYVPLQLKGDNTHVITDSITISQTIQANQTKFLTISQTVTASQLIVKLGTTHLVTISHDVTTADSIRVGKNLHLTVSDSVVSSQSFKQLGIIIHNVTISQAISVTKILSRLLTDNIIVTQLPFINSPRQITLYHNVSVLDYNITRSGTYRQNVTDTVTVQDIIVPRLATFHLNIIDSVVTSQFVRRINAVYNLALVQSVTTNQRINLQYSESVSHDINIFHTYSRKRYVTGSITTTSTITNSFDRNIVYLISTSLTEVSNFDRTISISRALTDSNFEKSTFGTVLFVTSQGPHPVVSGVPISYGYLTLLESQYGSIVLPVPELNDSTKHNDKIDLKRSMSGNLSAYVKKSTTIILSYTWLLDYPKALELKNWAFANFSERITLTNWKGEIYVGKIISDDLTLKAETKYAGNARQKTSVTVDFEGIKING